MHAHLVSRFLDAPLLAHRHLLVMALAAWVLFSLYWDFVGKKSAATKCAETRHSRAFHVWLTNAAFLLAAAPLRVLGRFAPVSHAFMITGLSLEWAGLLFAIWARRHLGSNWSGEISIKVAHQLIESGPYRVLRHPIYTGLLAMYLGTALVMGEWLALIGVAIAIVAYVRKIRLEEKSLGTAFGSSYEQYRKQRWAVVPGLF